MLAANQSQKLLMLLIASAIEPLSGRRFFGARPYQTINAHSAPAEVPLKPTSSNLFRASISQDFGKDPDLEGGVRSAALASDGHLRREINHCSTSLA